MAVSSEPSSTDPGVLAELRRVIDEPRIASHFQPIVDLRSGTPLGYEVLSRCSSPFESIEQLFRIAKDHGLSWDLERTCRATAFSLRSQRRSRSESSSQPSKPGAAPSFSSGDDTP